MRILSSLIFCLSIVQPQWVDARSVKLKIFTIHSRPAAEVVEMVRPLLSQRGKVLADSRTNKLIVYDDPSKFAGIESLLKAVDVPSKNVRVKLRMVDEEEFKRSGLGVRWVDWGNEWRIGTFLENRAINWNVKASQEIVVLDGQEGQIFVGSSIPVSGAFLQYLYGYGYVVPTVQIYKASTGFKVKPRVRDSQIELEIVPILQYPDPSGLHLIRFGEASTNVRVRSGESFVLVQTDKTGESVSHFILGEAQSKEGLRLLMVVTADIEP